MNQDQPQIIVVNDDPAQLQLITCIIERESARVFSFLRAADALSHIAELQTVDLVVTDLHMPGIDGWRFCHLLRSSEFPGTNHTPILIVSATLSQSDAGAMPRDLGADAFLSMPFSPQELQQTVRHLLHHQPPEKQALVLIVIDHPGERQQIADAFAAHSYKTLQAASCAQARAILRSHRPDVVILEHKPPEIESTGLLSELKVDPHVTILAITDGQSANLAIELTNLGADAHIAKPYDAVSLLDQVAKAQQGRVMVYVENTLETWVQEALRNARRIQRLNDSFLAFGTDYGNNIQILIRTAGELLYSDYAIYYHRGPSNPSVLVYPVAAEQLPDQPQDLLESLEVMTVREDGLRIVHYSADDSDEPASRSLYQYYGLQTCIWHPILVQGYSVGLLGVGYVTDHEPSAEDVNLVQLLVRAIERQEHLEQREQELRALNELGRVVTSTLTLDEVLTKLRQRVREVLGTEACSIALIDPQTAELVFRQADDPLANELVGQRLQPGQGIAGQVALTGRSILVPDTGADPRFYPGIDQATGLRTRGIICAPLVAQDRTIGVIEAVNKRHGAFTQADVRLLESVAAQTASALENARLHEVTERELAERIKAEQALQESKTRLQTFIDVTSDLIFLKDDQLRYTLVNQAFLEHWELEQQEVIGRTDQDFMPAQQAQMYHSAESQILNEQQGTSVEEQQGSQTYEIHRTPVLDPLGRTAGIAGVIRNVTERKRLQEQLIQEQKEESILTLATGIVHDFNNALVGIVGNIDILRLDLPDSANVQRTLHAMERSAQRMVDLTSQLLAYAGGGGYRRQPVDLNAVVSESLRMLQIPEHVRIECKLAPDLGPVEGDPNQLKQVLINLVTNAFEAMDQQDGMLQISTENKWNEQWTCRSNHPHPEGEYIHLLVTDTGPGMDNQVKRRLFEPFFSTKFLGRGLGLAAAQGIVRDHQGCIQIESVPGQGTTVHVYLPRCAKTAPDAQEPILETSRDQTILVVENEPVVGHLVQRALSQHGYQVILTAGGEYVTRDRADPVDVALISMEAVRDQGLDLLARLYTQYPDLCVLLTGDYEPGKAVTDATAGKRVQFLQKPFSLEELVTGVQELLGKRP